MKDGSINPEVFVFQKKAGHHLNAKQAHDILLALKELKDFMIDNGVPVKDRQKLMRNLRVCAE